ncbi:MAG: NAD-dependent epimerase/dehydratase family protein [Alphaproteobacteria bacterium]|nr:NAD-dependent epimerase/dehydratase family protein [Alphaproteobacteria bacterium]
MSDTFQQVLIVGGGGFIGKKVVAAFVAAGARVSVLDMVAADRDDVEWIVGSLSDPTLVAAAVNGCDTVIFLANSSLPGSSQADLSAEIQSHVFVSIKAAEICSNLGVKAFIFASSGGTVYGYSPLPGTGLLETDLTRPINAYGVSKLAIEHYLRLLSDLRPMRTVSLRISNPYGEGQRATRGQGVIAAAMQHTFKNTPMKIWGDGSAERDFLHVDDVAEAFVAATRYRGTERVFNIGSGACWSLRDTLNAVQVATGQPLKIVYEPGRTVDVQRNQLDISLSSRELGWAPKIELAEGLMRTAAWWLTPRD